MINAEQVKRDIIVIGTSAGGVGPLHRLLALLPSGLPGTIAIVIHRSPFYNLNMAQAFGQVATLPVVEPRNGDPIHPGTIYFAPPDHHLKLGPSHFRVEKGPMEHRARPAIDPLFQTAAQAYGPRTVGVILAGTSDDGCEGLVAIKKAGGLALVQDPIEAVLATLPDNALARTKVDLVATVQRLAEVIVAVVHGKAVPAV